MKLEKAIEIQTARAKDFRPGYDPDEREAAKLSVEALKFTISSRDPHGVPPYSLLPGETED